MKILRHSVALIISFGAACAWAGNAVPAQPGETVAPNQYIVKFNAPAHAAALNGAVFSALPGGAALTPIDQGLYVLSLPPGADAPDFVSAFAANPMVEFIEPNRIRSVTVQTANDPSFASQWALAAVQALQAWQIVPDRYFDASQPEARRIKVAVLDTGVDCTHPDFANSGGASADAAQGGQLSFALSRAPVPTTVASPACGWQDDYGHGTHVAGIIAAATQNGIGVSALGYPLELIVYKVLGANGSGDDAAIAGAIIAAADAGARVISLSLGGPGYSHSVQMAVNYAWQRDALVVAAAGNSSSNGIFFPADANFAVAVAATDSSNSRAGFSNFGSAIDISAPGVGILSTLPTYGTPLGGLNYGWLSGTSMATPHVSALAGLLAMLNPNAPAAAILQRIQQSASSTVSNGGWDQFYGYGVINAYNALAGNLRPSTLGSLVGQVVETHSFPLIAQVTVNGQTITTDTTGTFRFANLAPGAYSITAVSSPYGTQTITGTVVAGADAPATVMIGAAYGRFTGRVADASGAGVSGATVQALTGGLIQATAVTGAAGQYTLWVSNGGPYDVRAAAIGRQTVTALAQSVSGGAAAVVNLTLPQLGTISGIVQDGNRKPVPNADVFILGNGGSTGAASDANGNYSTTGLAAGVYSVTASASGLPSAVVNNVAISGGVSTVNLTLGQPAAPVSVSVSPLNVSLTGGQTQQFAASVSGSAGVTWSLRPAVGSVVNGLYIAPAIVAAAQTVNVIATSVADPSKWAVASLSLVPVSISADPPSASLWVGQSRQFSANVSGAGNTAVLWTLNPPVGTVVNGLYTAPPSIPSAAAVNVVAASAADPSKSVTVSIALNPVAISVAPNSVSLASGHSQLFTAAVAGPANTGVVWSISPPAAGSIAPNGNYTAPANVPVPQTVIVTATSAADPARAATAVISLVPSPPVASVSISINPAAVSLSGYQLQQFSAAVSGAPQTGVAWSMTPPLGTLYQNGLYVAPEATSAPQTVSITATSVADPSKAATATVTVRPFVRVAVAPNAVWVSPSGQVQFSAAVTGASDTRVAWTIFPARGAIGATGLYTAPADVKSVEIVNITAASLADPQSRVTTIVFLKP